MKGTEMPLLEQTKSNKLVKGMVIADSGTGKSGALAALAAAGYRLLIYDFDAGTQILMDETILPKQFRENIYVNQYLDRVRPTASGPMYESPPTAFSRALKDLYIHPDVGPVEKLGDKDVIVIDSGTFFSEAAMRYFLNAAGRLNDRPQIQDYGITMDKIEEVFELLYEPTVVPCNVIVNFHFQYIEQNTGNSQMLTALSGIAADKNNKELSKAASEHLVGAFQPGQRYPSTIGKKLAPKLGRYFNTVVSMKSLGTGAGESRKMLTRSEGDLALKVPCPGKIPAMLDIKVAWPTIFKAIRGE